MHPSTMRSVWLREDNGGTTSKRYVNNKSATKSVGSYDWSAPFEMDMIEEEKAVDYIVQIGRKEKTGADAETEYIRVDLKGEKGASGYPARKRKVAIEVADFTDNDGEIVGSGNLLGNLWHFPILCRNMLHGTETCFQETLRGNIMESVLLHVLSWIHCCTIHL